MLVQKLVHKIKNSALYCGAILLQKTCFDLENFIRTKQVNISVDSFNKFQTTVSKTLKVAKHWLNNQTK
ncbi:Hpt domain-containing protein [Legionella fairfieldensis]|uniref:Hpt domain-containing protein n=1 Tax=Legionella fairfieldensis TaxID=45064 RepID=UPI003BF7DA21